MNKLFGSGAQVTYGPDLPTAEKTFDGALHYRTGTGEGLYIYSIVQDVNAFQVGDQVSKRWTPITLKESSNQILGGTINGSLQIISQDFYNGLTFSNDTYSSTGYIGARSGDKTGVQFGSNAGPVVLSAGVLNGGNGSAVLSFTKGGPLQYWPDFSVQSSGGNVWHSGNDGSGSGMDADMLDGQDGAYYLNAGNLNAGTINIARLPHASVQQGGGSGMATNKIYIGWTAGGNLALQVDTTSFGATWPISITGNAAQATTASYANSAGAANTATTATNATFATTAGSAASANLATTATKANNVVSISDVWNTQQDWKAVNNFVTNNRTVTSTGNGFNLRAIQNGGTGGGGMTFSHPNASINMGLDTDNIFRIGGFSFGQLLALDNTGNATFTGTVTESSDFRLKKDIATISNALYKIGQLNGVTYARKSDDSRATGLIAQEVRAVLPEAVLENSGWLSLSYGNMAGLFVEAIKELKAEVESLKKQVAALKSST